MRTRRLPRRKQPICTHKISIQSSKSSHAYAIIRLRRKFRELAGSKADIYQAMHDGLRINLAFTFHSANFLVSDVR
jgi:hypothetical protein